MFGEAGNVAAVGRFVLTPHERDLGRGDTDFVDIFILTESGLILGQRRFLAPLYHPG